MKDSVNIKKHNIVNNALLPTPINIAENITVYPITLATLAMLDKIQSFLLYPEHNEDRFNIIKTLYICTRKDIKELYSNFDQLDELALDFVNTIPFSLTTSIIEDGIAKQLDAAFAVAPSGSDNTKKN